MRKKSKFSKNTILANFDQVGPEISVTPENPKSQKSHHLDLSEVENRKHEKK